MSVKKRKLTISYAFNSEFYAWVLFIKKIQQLSMIFMSEI